MNKLMRWIVALIALTGSALYAQEITGSWQGTLKPGPQDLRLVVKISQDGDKLAAVLYAIDQGGQSLNASAVTHTGATVKFTISTIGASYEGKLSADGNSITGTFTQGAPIPLNLVRATPATEWAIPEPPPPPKTMAEEAAPQFEVATIKPSKPDSRFSLLVNRSGMMNSTSSSLSDLIKFAYDLHPHQIVGGPTWLELEKYDVSGKPDTPGIPNMKQLKAMVQQLLGDRFSLAFHREKRDLSAYAITVAKTGVKMTKDESNPKGLPGIGGGPQGLLVRNATIAEFAAMLQANILELPVVDQTGLGAARWDFTLKWTPDPGQRQLGAPDAAPPVPDNPDAPPDFFAACLQQLGLKLESTKAPVDVIVIDKVEKPSAN